MGLSRKEIENLPDGNPIKEQVKRSDIEDKGKAKRKYPESRLQQNAVEVFRLQWPDKKWKLFSIPNEGIRGKANRSRMKAEGMVSGVWDLFLAVPRGKFGGYWIETKVGYNGLTDTQKAFRDRLNGDYWFFVYRNIAEFCDRVNNYLNK